MKMVIYPMFKKWLKQASKQDLEKLVKDVNDMARSLREKGKK